MVIIGCFSFDVLEKYQGYIVNLHQTSNNGNELSELIYRNEEKEDVENHTSSSSTKSTSKASQSEKSKPGPAYIVKKFPTIPDVATEFIKRNGFKAQNKRRDDDFVSCGVSVEEVRQHLLKTVTGLAEYGLCKNTVQYLFKTVTKS